MAVAVIVVAAVSIAGDAAFGNADRDREDVLLRLSLSGECE